MNPASQAHAAYPPTSSEQFKAVRAFFGQIFREELRALLPQLANPTAPAPTPSLGGIELACEVTGLSKARIYALVSEGAIPNSKKGNRLFFDRAELTAWIAEGSRPVRKRK